MERLRANNTELKNSKAPETAKTGRTDNLTSFIDTFFKSFSSFARTLDELSLSTRLILLILSLSLFLPISVGLMVYLIFLGLSLVFKGGGS